MAYNIHIYIYWRINIDDRLRQLVRQNEENKIRYE